MPNATVTLMLRARTEEGAKAIWKRYPAAIGRNGRIRPGYALVNAQQVHFSGAHYELRYYQGRKVKYESAGQTAASALAARLNKERLLKAKTAAADAGPSVTLVEVPGRKYLRRVANLYIQDRKNQGAAEAARQAENVTGEFMAESGRTFLDEVTKDDIYRYHAALRKRGNADRTVANKHQRLRAFLRFAGVDVKVVMPQKPRFEKELPTVYGSEQTDSLLRVADDFMRLVIELGMKCGLREAEMVYLEWPDIQWTDKVLRVQGKPHWHFKVKDSEQRDVPVPDDLLTHLKAWKEAQQKMRSVARSVSRNTKQKEHIRLVLGTKQDRPNTHLLRQLKRLAHRAGLNCGVCDGCKRGAEEARECYEWTLHRLRRTYATTLLRHGIDLRTVQHFMGHADLASTSRYLRPAGSKETQAAITGIFAAK